MRSSWTRPGSVTGIGQSSIHLLVSALVYLSIYLKRHDMFTPVHTTLGALLLFSGSYGLLAHNGRVFGISSILRSCLLQPASWRGDDNNWPILAGLVSSPLLLALVMPSLLPSYPPDAFSTAATGGMSIWAPVVRTIGLGVLTGWGTKVYRDCKKKKWVE